LKRGGSKHLNMKMMIIKIRPKYQKGFLITGGKIRDEL